MAQCKGTTKAGSRCRRSAAEGSAFCSIHEGEEERRTDSRSGDPVDLTDTAKAILGVVLIGAIAYFFGGFRRPPRIF